MEINFKFAECSDVDTILDFMADFYKSENMIYKRDNAKTALINLCENKEYGALFLIQSSLEVIGYCFIAFGYTLQYNGKDAFLDEIYIKPGFRQRGIGKIALQYIHDYLKENNFMAMHLIVHNHNHKAFRYYANNGFTAHKASYMTRVIDREK